MSPRSTLEGVAAPSRHQVWRTCFARFDELAARGPLVVPPQGESGKLTLTYPHSRYAQLGWLCVRLPRVDDGHAGRRERRCVPRRNVNPCASAIADLAVRKRDRLSSSPRAADEPRVNRGGLLVEWQDAQAEELRSGALMREARAALSRRPLGGWRIILDTGPFP
jgi:hypothetical protein